MPIAARVLLALLVLCGFVPVASAAPGATFAPLDWRQFRLDASHTGFNRFEHVLDVSNVSSLSNTWQAELGELVFSSSPAWLMRSSHI